MNLSPKDFLKITLSRLGLRNPFNKVFKVIEFETTSYCNRKCDYCPNVDFERFGEEDGFFMKEEVFKTFYQSCFFGVITFLSFIQMFILGTVVGISLKKGFKVSVNDFTPILPNNMQILIYILSLVGFIIFLTFALRKKEYKILFKDIRNVDSILNHMITENPSFAIKYEIVEQTGNRISYYPYASKLSLLKAFEDSFNRKMVKILPFMKDFETLQLSFDGNVVIARGMAGGVDKLKKRLKILELI